MKSVHKKAAQVGGLSGGPGAGPPVPVLDSLWPRQGWLGGRGYQRKDQDLQGEEVLLLHDLEFRLGRDSIDEISTYYSEQLID